MLKSSQEWIIETMVTVAVKLVGALFPKNITETRGAASGRCGCVRKIAHTHSRWGIASSPFDNKKHEQQDKYDKVTIGRHAKSSGEGLRFVAWSFSSRLRPENSRCLSSSAHHRPHRMGCPQVRVPSHKMGSRILLLDLQRLRRISLSARRMRKLSIHQHMCSESDDCADLQVDLSSPRARRI